MTIIGDNVKVVLIGSIFSNNYKHAKEIADQITALLWGLI